MNDSTQLNVALGDRSYPIVIGEGVIEEAGERIAAISKNLHVIIITDDAVAPHYLSVVEQSVKASAVRCESIVVPAGEKSKSFTQLEALMNQLLEFKPERGTLLIALGGGVIGDLTGFAASVLLRGVDFVQIPTTLLAQVDSSVGGKTGINTPQGKNLVGSFHQPKLVLADTNVLKTLPRRQVLAGYAEIVKYGLLGDVAFFEWLEEYGTALLEGDAEAIQYAVNRSCEMKAEIVAQDEREAGKRALLNLGHTFGHALEAETGYTDALLHGEAVAIGMVMACLLSEKMDLIDASIASRVKAHMQSVGLPVSPLDIRPNWNADALLAHCYQDKKVQDGALTFIILQQLGDAAVEHHVDSAMVKEVFEEAIQK
jgi:3-dehydroquinate synthase